MGKTENRKNTFWENYSFPILLLSGIAVGSIIGVILKEKAAILKPFGDIFINLMFTAVVPLVFVTISLAYTIWSYMKMFGRLDESFVANNKNSLY